MVTVVRIRINASGNNYELWKIIEVYWKGLLNVFVLEKLSYPLTILCVDKRIRANTSWLI
jgi:hypothetical protein